MANRFEIEPLPFAPGEVNINLGILETARSAEALSNFGTVCLTLGKTKDDRDLKKTFWSPKILREIPEDFEPTLNNREGLLQLKPKGRARLLSWLYTKTIEPNDLYLVDEKLTGIKYVGQDGLLRHARSKHVVDMKPFNCHPNKTDEAFHIKILDQKRLGEFVYYVAFQNLHPKKQAGRNIWKPTGGFEWTEETIMIPDGVVFSRNCIPIARSIEP